MTARPPERIIDTMTLYTADGTPVLVLRWTNPTLTGGAWQEGGPPSLRTADGHPLSHLRAGQYQDEVTGDILYADNPAPPPSTQTGRPDGGRDAVCGQVRGAGVMRMTSEGAGDYRQRSSRATHAAKAGTRLPHGRPSAA